MVDRIGVLTTASETDVDGMAVSADKLDRVKVLRDDRAACAKSLSAMKRDSSSAESAIKKAGREVVKLLESASICPLSGGKLFDECKQLIGEAR